MEITELIQHPESMDRDTLYELRSMLALYPYFQTARLLMLQNLYLLHDPTFDEELRRAALYITDRRVVFDMVEAGYYQMWQPQGTQSKTATQASGDKAESRTMSLINNFLGSIPADSDAKPKKRRPTPADAAVDYVAYLMESEGDEDEEVKEVPEMKGQNLIDTFINSDNGRFVLNDKPEYTPTIDDTLQDDENGVDEGYFTETLARIYIKQGRYSKALEIIQRLSLQFPKKNAYFADQIRFLEKLIINNNKNK